MVHQKSELGSIYISNEYFQVLPKWSILNLICITTTSLEWGNDWLTVFGSFKWKNPVKHRILVVVYRIELLLQKAFIWKRNVKQVLFLKVHHENHKSLIELIKATLIGGGYARLAWKMSWITKNEAQHTHTPSPHTHPHTHPPPPHTHAQNNQHVTN